MTIERRRLTQEVASAIQQQIVELELRPGDRLPSHSSLAEQLSISIPSLREGLQILAALGIIKLEHGRGTEIGQPSIADYLHSVNPVLLSRSYTSQECVDLLSSVLQPLFEDLSHIQFQSDQLNESIQRMEDVGSSQIMKALSDFFHILLVPLNRPLAREVVELALQLLLASPVQQDALVSAAPEIAASFHDLVSALTARNTSDAWSIYTRISEILLSLRAEKDELKCATGSIGGTFFTTGLEIASAAYSQSSEYINTVPTEGGIQNLRLLQKGVVNTALTQANVARRAFEGRSPFDEPISDLSVICRTHSLDLWVVTRDSNSIQDLQDMSGLRISIGTESGYTSDIVTTLLEICGYGPSDLDIRHYSISQATNAFSQEDIDVLFFLSSGMGTAISRLAESQSLRLIPIPDTVIERLCKEEEGIVRSSIPSLDGRETVTTARVDTLMVCRDSLPKERVEVLWNAVKTAAGTSEILTPELRPGFFQL